jgi:1,4-dihydroxy-2-naphthoate octaprenyltransferase
LLLVAYATLVAVLWLGWTATWVLLPLLTIPQAVPLFRSVARDRGVALNPTLARTAKLLSVFGVLFAIGIVL